MGFKILLITKDRKYQSVENIKSEQFSCKKISSTEFSTNDNDNVGVI